MSPAEVTSPGGVVRTLTYLTMISPSMLLWMVQRYM